MAWFWFGAWLLTLASAVVALRRASKRPVLHRVTRSLFPGPTPLHTVECTCGFVAIHDNQADAEATLEEHTQHHLDGNK